MACQMLPRISLGDAIPSNCAFDQSIAPKTCTSQLVTGAPSGSGTCHCRVSLSDWQRMHSIANGAPGFSEVLNLFCSQSPEPEALQPRTRIALSVSPSNPQKVARQTLSLTFSGFWLNWLLS